MHTPPSSPASPTRRTRPRFRRPTSAMLPIAVAALSAWAVPADQSHAGGLPRVALVASASDSQLTDVQSKLVGTGQFSAVDVYNVSDTPPRPLPGQLGLLMGYDAVMVWTNNNLTGPDVLGDLFADYVDTGKGVVLAVSAMTSTTATRNLQGRWASGGYGIIDVSNPGTTTSTTNVGTIHVAMHPIMAGVTNIDTNFSIRTRSATTLLGHGVRVSDWLDGAPLVTVSSTPALNRRADIGLYPPSSDSTSTFWDATTDGAVLMANAITFSAQGMGGSFPPAADVSFSTNVAVAGGSLTITADVEPGVNPASSGVTVRADLSAFGGASDQLLADQGGGMHTFTLNIPAMQASGEYAVNFTVADAQARSTPTRAGFYVLAAPPAGYVTEVEPNEGKAVATPAMITHDTGVYGITTGSSVNTDGSLITPDYFLLTTAPLTPGIYRHTMVLETDGTAGHGASIRGYSQSSGNINTASDTAIQTSTTTTFTPRAVAWYGFGGSEQIYYRVTGSTSTTQPYRARLETQPVTPVDLGVNLQPGEITISRFVSNTTTVDMMVYNQNFQAQADFNVDGTGTLIRTFTPGTYYLAVSNVNTCDHRPSGPDSTSLTGPVQHFPGSVTNSSTAGIGDLSMEFNDGVNLPSVFLTKDIFFGVAWAKFVVEGTVCPGDFNGDESVDLADLIAFNTLWQPNIGLNVPVGTLGDYNGDGTVDLADLIGFNTDWQPNIGVPCP